jgi:GNAT superfamily N-acetyltransferase
VNVRFQRLNTGPRGRVPTDPALPPDELRRLDERSGERILAVDAENGTVWGMISLTPDRDEGGRFFQLAALDVLPAYRGRGIDAALMEEAERFIRSRKVTRLKFGTSPLRTDHAELYIKGFGTRYRWREGTRTPENKPWPHVSCECDLDDPLARPLDLGEEEVISRSVVHWEGLHPLPRRSIVYSGPLAVLLPDLTGEALAAAGGRDPSLLSAMYEVFHALYMHGYGFAWFDRLPPDLAPAGSPCWYYVMSRVLAL